MFSPDYKKKNTPVHFGAEWGFESLCKQEIETALTELRDYLDICRDYPPHPEVYQALQFFENKDYKTFQAVQNFKRALKCPDQNARYMALTNMYNLIRRQFGY